MAFWSEVFAIGAVSGNRRTCQDPWICVVGWRFRHLSEVARIAGMQLPAGLLTSESLGSFGGRQGSFRGRDYWEVDLPLARVPDLVRGESVNARVTPSQIHITTDMITEPPTVG